MVGPMMAAEGAKHGANFFNRHKGILAIGAIGAFGIAASGALQEVGLPIPNITEWFDKGEDKFTLQDASMVQLALAGAQRTCFVDQTTQLDIEGHDEQNVPITGWTWRDNTIPGHFIGKYSLCADREATDIIVKPDTETEKGGVTIIVNSVYTQGGIVEEESYVGWNESAADTLIGQLNYDPSDAQDTLRVIGQRLMQRYTCNVQAYEVFEMEGQKFYGGLAETFSGGELTADQVTFVINAEQPQGSYPTGRADNEALQDDLGLEEKIKSGLKVDVIGTTCPSTVIDSEGNVVDPDQMSDQEAAGIPG